jgi:mandelate racemase
VRAIRTTAVEVPMTYTLGTSAEAVRTAPLLLLDLETEEGITGHAYLFCYLPAAAPAISSFISEAERTVKGERVAPVDLQMRLEKRFTLLGAQGVVRMAMAALDVAAWDALARAAGLPLAVYLGGTVKTIRAYNSCGLGLMAPQAVADEAEKLLAGGFRAVKLRLGYPTLEADLAAVRAVRKRISGDIAIMADFNQALSVAEALRRGRALDGEGVYWIEEPIRHDDYAGAARLARELATPVQIGENFFGPRAMTDALAANACDYVMPDLARIDGVTGWQHAAALAAARGIEMSSHLYPEVSAHLLAVTPTCHWLEYVDWANAILEEPLRIEDGRAIVAERPGNGLSWDKTAVQRYQVSG